MRASAASSASPIGEFQMVQQMLADSAMEINAARLLVLQAASEIDQGHDARERISMVKVYAAEMLGRVADRAVQVHGGMGYCRDLPIERFYRDARIFRIYDGTSEIHRGDHRPGDHEARFVAVRGCHLIEERVDAGRIMAINKFMTAEAAAALISDGDTVALIGGGGGLVEATCLHEAIEKRFLATAHPRDLTVVHSLGIGDRKTRGMNRFAHEGMVQARDRRALGLVAAHAAAGAKTTRSRPTCCRAASAMQLFREIGAGRPGLFTHVGLGTFCRSARRWRPHEQARPRSRSPRWSPSMAASCCATSRFPVNVAVIRGSFADAHGNISLDQEPANVDIYAAALAAHNSGGKVIVQVRTAVEVGALPARSVRVPGAIVDAVVVDPGQSMGYDVVYDPTMSGEIKGPPSPFAPQPFTVRQLIARRAADELRDGAVLNYGFGIPDGVAKLIAERGHLDRYYQTIEHGTYGGELLEGTLFGYARNATAMIDGPSQFDFYSGGGLDIAFLGFGEIDAAGNVNVSKLGGVTVGPGGFIDIAQNAKKVVFCGTFDAKGTQARDRRRQAADQAPRRGDQARRRTSSRSPIRAAKR